MPTSKIHGYRPSYSAPQTEKVGSRQPRESLRAFLERIRRTEKDIVVQRPNKRDLLLLDLPADEWADYVSKLYEEANER